MCRRPWRPVAANPVFTDQLLNGKGIRHGHHAAEAHAVCQQIADCRILVLPGLISLPNGIVVWFAGWKKHYSLYPATDHVVEAVKDGLAAYKVSKGTIRFLLSEPVPMKLIERIAKFRAQEIAGSRR